MRLKLLFGPLCIILLLVMLMFSSASLCSQDIAEIVTDTTKKVPETIALPDISIRSGEMVITMKKLVESLIPDQKITQLNQQNDSILGIIDSLLKIEKEVELSTKNIRYLNNRLVYWDGYSLKVGSQKTQLSGIVKGLDSKRYELEEEILIWGNTKNAIVKDDPAASVIARIDDLMLRMDSVKILIQGKSAPVLKMLDHTTVKGLAVEEYIDALEASMKSKQGKIFAKYQPALWQTNFANKDNWRVTYPLRQFNRMEIKEMISYFKNHIPNSIVQVLLIVLLIIAFGGIGKRLRKAEINKNSLYQKYLVKIFSMPVSAALVLGLFASVLIFPNRPLIFRDLSRLLVAIPLVIIVTTITAKALHKYFFILILLMIIQLVSFIYPPGNNFYLISLVLIGIIEVWVLISLLGYFKKHPIHNPYLNKLISILVFVHLGFVIAGLLGIIMGASLLAELTLNVTIINVFIGMLVVISAIILDGLIEFGIESASFRQVNVFRLYGDEVKKRSIRLINLGGMTLWFYTILKVININRIVVDGMSEFLSDEINIGSASFTLGGVLIFFLVIWLSIVLSKIIRAILEEDVLNKLNLAKGVPHTISVLVRYTLVTIGLMLAVSAAGMPLDKLTILFGAFGVGIGFGLQNIFNNLVSGLILLFERPIQIGDTIEVGQLMGNVKSIGIRSSNIRTFDGAEVIVPNGQLISNEVVNWTLSDQTRRIEVIVGVAYGSDPHKVKTLFEKVLESHPDIIKLPAPSVFFRDLGESSLDFRLLFWTSNFAEWVRIRSEIVFNVHDILKEEGIEIPFPQRDLHLRSVDQQIEIVKKEKKEERPDPS